MSQGLRADTPVPAGPEPTGNHPSDPVLDCGLARSAPVAMTIAGSDASGGAGLQADLKTFHQFGVFGLAVPTLITVQNTLGIQQVHPVGADLVRAQLDCVAEDIRPAAVKTGALGQTETVRAVADWSRGLGAPLVVDPVMLSSDGRSLASEDAIKAIVRDLLPLCDLVTPNLREASVLSGIKVQSVGQMREAAKRISGLGAPNVVVKGGHLDGDAVDVMWAQGQVREYRSRRVESTSTHGTGCTYSAAITALLARGNVLEEAIGEAKQYVTEAIRTAPDLGSGHGPLNHHATPASGSG